MQTLLVAMLVSASAGSAAQPGPFHDRISMIFRGTWAPTAAACRDPEGTNKVFVDGESVNYYEGNDYLLLGIEFGGAMTRPGSSGSLFNGRFTSRTEPNILGESNIRLEVDDRNKDVMYR